MDMPKPSAEHRKLEALVGEWVGDETLYPSPWAPEVRTAVGRFHIRLDVDGMFLINDYVEERDGNVVYRGHGVYGYDAKRGKYTMFWFDSMGMSPNETLGTWDGQVLTFENSSPQGSARYVYEVLGADQMAFRILTSADGTDWKPLMDGVYQRQS